jgi:polysaccharide deacetylase 2 family uncharacterized protein YibQ
VNCPLAVAIIPGLEYSTQLAESFHNAGKEILIHLPMESEGESEDEDLTLKVSMIPQEIRGRLYQAIYDIPFARGISNHQGSLFTADEEAMNHLAQVLADTNLYFLDSITSPKTVAFNICRHWEIPTLQRDIFLDTELEAGETISDRFVQLVLIAKKKGYAVGIGHRHWETLKALEEFLRSPASEELELVFPSELIKELQNEKIR